MNDPAPNDDEPEYIPDPEKEQQAKNVHFTVSIIRLLAVGLLIAGIVIATNRMAPIPPWPGYVLIGVALFQMWFVPIWIIRQFVKARVAEEEAAEANAKQQDDE